MGEGGFGARFAEISRHCCTHPYVSRNWTRGLQMILIDGRNIEGVDPSDECKPGS